MSHEHDTNQSFNRNFDTYIELIISSLPNYSKWIAAHFGFFSLFFFLIFILPYLTICSRTNRCKHLIAFGNFPFGSIYLCLIKPGHFLACSQTNFPKLIGITEFNRIKPIKTMYFFDTTV